MIASPDIASVGSGSLVGFVLGLIGGGGSILAVPLLVYVVGVASPHVAIGTSSVAVALSAFSNLVGHARVGNVRWPCAIVFSLAGIAGAAAGSAIGKRFDGQKLLLLFGLLMIVIAVMMLVRRKGHGTQFRPLERATAGTLLPRLLGMGGAVGGMSGFFGIGGGFLLNKVGGDPDQVVPGLMAAARMPMITAIGSSLVAVTAFGITTAVSYALSGLVDWHIAALFVAGGVAGGVGGTLLAHRLATHKTMLTRVFAGIVAVVGLYVVWRGYGAVVAPA